MVEIIPKKVFTLPRWFSFLFYFSLALLFFSIIYIVLNHFNIKKSQEALADLEQALIEEETSEKIALEKEMLNYERKIKNFSQLINQHLKTSKIFEFLQENCHPKVYFNSFSLDSRQRIAIVSGETDSFESLGQQYLILKANPDVKGVTLSNISIAKMGKINFNLSISLDSKLLKY